MFERAPFIDCPNCKGNRFGILSAGGKILTRRCASCRLSTHETLPVISKAVIYLDQFAISNIFKVKSSSRSINDPWPRFEKAANAALLLQQAIFPASDVHSDEIIVFSAASDLSIAHEMLGGDTRFKDVITVELEEYIAFAEAFSRGLSAPELDHNSNAALVGKKDKWLKDLHITAQFDYSVLADDIRKRRNATATDFNSLIDDWTRRKPTFKEALEIELGGLANANVSSLRTAGQKFEADLSIDAFNASRELESNQIYRRYSDLRALFERHGTPKEASGAKVVEFWQWKEMRHLPHHKISSYLFAAVARKFSSGQKKYPTQGFMNDVRAIATYAPYVDAMFIDRECAELLRQEPLRSDLHFRAKIFSLSSVDLFLDYLDSLSARASTEVSAYAKIIYGFDF